MYSKGVETMSKGEFETRLSEERRKRDDAESRAKAAEERAQLAEQKLNLAKAHFGQLEKAIQTISGQMAIIEPIVHEMDEVKGSRNRR